MSMLYVSCVFATVFSGPRLAAAASLRSTRNSDKSGSIAYDYHTHGQDWMAGQCASRTRQSPIDFPKTLPKQAMGHFSYKYEVVPVPFEVMNNGHLYAADFTGLGYGGVTYENAWYNLASITVHSFSEHTWGGVHYPIELHMIHKKADSDALLNIAIPVSCITLPPLYLQTNASRSRVRVHTAQGERSAHEGSGHRAAACSNNTNGQFPPMPCGPPAGYVGYTPPPSWQWYFNPQLQKFLSVEPPPVNMKVTSPVLPNDPLDLNAFVKGGKYYEYAGSTTSPPCSEIVTWMVRDSPIMASDLQVGYLVDGIFRMNNFYGNYRTVMPLISRSITVRDAVEEQPPLVSDSPAMPDSDVVKTEREHLTQKWAKESLKMAKNSLDYVKGLDERLRKAAVARADAANAPPPKIEVTVTTAPTVSPAALAKQAETLAATIAYAAKTAVAGAVWQISAAAKTAAIDAAKEAAETVSVSAFAGGGALPNTPPPTMMPGMR